MTTISIDGETIPPKTKQAKFMNANNDDSIPIDISQDKLQNPDLLVASMVVAVETIEMAVHQLRILHSVDSSSQYVEVIGSFDGAYQQRSGKSGGGFSHYCFAAAISAETGKVLAYGAACNSCAYCSTIANQLRDSVISPEEHESKMSIHKPECSSE